MTIDHRPVISIAAAIIRNENTVLLVRQQGSDDPDHFVTDARFVPLTKAVSLLGQIPFRVMHEPIVAYLEERAGRGAVWKYCRQPDGVDALVARSHGEDST